MAYKTQPTESLIKFVRGTKTQFNQITKSNDTLYFIYESDDSTVGELYLGNKQIGDGSIDSIKDLISDAVNDGDLLIYDEASEDWIPTSLDDAIRVVTGATATDNGQSGLVPAPQAGDQSKFLRGDGTWATVSAGLSAVDGTSIIQSNDALAINGFADASVGTIPRKTTNGIEWYNPSSVTGLTYKKVDTLTEVTDSATIYLVPNNNGTTNNLFDEYMVIDGAPELINQATPVDLSGYVTTTNLQSTLTSTLNDYVKSSDLTTTLTGYVTTDTLNNYVTTATFNSTVGSLDSLNRQAGEDSTLVEEINNINERLAWQEIVEE